jgi:hypothetical protein
MQQHAGMRYPSIMGCGACTTAHFWLRLESISQQVHASSCKFTCVDKQPPAILILADIFNDRQLC